MTLRHGALAILAVLIVQVRLGPPAAAAPALGTIKGRVVFEGTPPTRAALDRTSDEYCAGQKGGGVSEDVVVGAKGGLKDVLVRLAVGAAKGKAPRKPAVIDQQGCAYVPHVIGVVAGQEISVKNSDQTMHNVHTFAGKETIFNLGQPAGAKEIRQDPEVAAGNVIRLACDVHPWMEAFAVVTDHPYFAVTSDSGAFVLKVPAGTYDLEAWHPKLGLQKVSVTVKAGKTVQATFQFKSGS